MARPKVRPYAPPRTKCVQRQLDRQGQTRREAGTQSQGSTSKATREDRPVAGLDDEIVRDEVNHEQDDAEAPLLVAGAPRGIGPDPRRWHALGRGLVMKTLVRSRIPRIILALSALASFALVLQAGHRWH